MFGNSLRNTFLMLHKPFWNESKTLKYLKQIGSLVWYMALNHWHPMVPRRPKFFPVFCFVLWVFFCFLSSTFSLSEDLSHFFQRDMKLLYLLRLRCTDVHVETVYLSTDKLFRYFFSSFIPSSHILCFIIYLVKLR